MPEKLQQISTSTVFDDQPNVLACFVPVDEFKQIWMVEIVHGGNLWKGAGDHSFARHYGAHVNEK